MTFIMVKTSQLSAFAFALYKAYCPAGISAVAGLTQQQVQQSANLRIWSKIRAVLGWSKFVSAYVKKDKKILKNMIFALAPLRKWSRVAVVVLR